MTMSFLILWYWLALPDCPSLCSVNSATMPLMQQAGNRPATGITMKRRMQGAEPVLASQLHSSILVHTSLEDSLAFVLANKLSSTTLLPTNVMQLVAKAYREDPVRLDLPPLAVMRHFCCHCCHSTQ